MLSYRDSGKISIGANIYDKLVNIFSRQRRGKKNKSVSQ